MTSISLHEAKNWERQNGGSEKSLRGASTIKYDIFHDWKTFSETLYIRIDEQWRGRILW